jgi:hypothetical protein
MSDVALITSYLQQTNNKGKRPAFESSFKGVKDVLSFIEIKTG